MAATRHLRSKGFQPRPAKNLTARAVNKGTRQVVESDEESDDDDDDDGDGDGDENKEPSEEEDEEDEEEDELEADEVSRDFSARSTAISLSGQENATVSVGRKPNDDDFIDDDEEPEKKRFKSTVAPKNRGAKRAMQKLNEEVGRS